MRKLLIYIFLLCSLSAFAQNNIKKTAGINYTQGVPTVTPDERTASEIAIDTVTGFVYQWHRTAGPTNFGGWRVLGQGIDVRVDLDPPTYTPFRNQSVFVVNAVDSLYYYHSGSWHHLNKYNPGGGGGGSLPNGNYSGQTITWTGSAWEPSWGNPYTFVTSGAAITTAVNEILIGTITGDVTMGLPTCSAANNGKHFKFVRNGTDAFSVTIDPAGAQTFYDGTSAKTSYGKLSIDCTCRYSGGVGVWFFDNF